MPQKQGEPLEIGLEQQISRRRFLEGLWTGAVTLVAVQESGLPQATLRKISNYWTRKQYEVAVEDHEAGRSDLARNITAELISGGRPYENPEEHLYLYEAGRINSLSLEAVISIQAGPRLEEIRGRYAGHLINSFRYETTFIGWRDVNKMVRYTTLSPGVYSALIFFPDTRNVVHHRDNGESLIDTIPVEVPEEARDLGHAGFHTSLWLHDYASVVLNALAGNLGINQRIAAREVKYEKRESMRNRKTDASTLLRASMVT